MEIIILLISFVVGWIIGYYIAKLQQIKRNKYEKPFYLKRIRRSSKISNKANKRNNRRIIKEG